MLQSYVLSYLLKHQLQRIDNSFQSSHPSRRSKLAALDIMCSQSDKTDCIAEVEMSHDSIFALIHTKFSQMPQRQNRA